jgi:hypothetical protein
MSDHRVEDAVDAIASSLKIIASMVANEETFPEVSRQEQALWDVRSLITFILDEIRKQKDTVQ